MRRLIRAAGLSALSLTAFATPALADAPTADQVVVRLAPPTGDATMSMRWSPKGATVALTPAEDGSLRGAFRLGPADVAPVAVRLFRSQDDASAPFDRLQLDDDRDGAFAGETVLTCTPTERRGSIWSSFSTVLSLPLPASTSDRTHRPYPLALWFVADPTTPDAAPALRWSRRGHLLGRTRLGDADAVLLLCERRMDGVIDEHDSWALAPADEPAAAATAGNARSVTDHAWLGESAWRMVSVDPSGLRAVLEPHDPGVTRAEEAEARDRLAVDRRAARSGDVVAFGHDFEAAVAESRATGRPLLVDFETTWCGPCKEMDRWVYTADVVVAASRDLVSVKVDGDESKDLVARFGVRAYPTIILLDAEGREIAREVGYVGVAGMRAFMAQATNDPR